MTNTINPLFFRVAILRKEKESNNLEKFKANCNCEWFVKALAIRYAFLIYYIIWYSIKHNTDVKYVASVIGKKARLQKSGTFATYY